VVRDVPPDMVVAGNPAKPIRPLAGKHPDHVNRTVAVEHGRRGK
jgi:acetyltransferase-like isoleucine patch superfamily enzyme